MAHDYQRTRESTGEGWGWMSTMAAVDLSAWLDKTLGRRHPVVAVGVVEHGEISVATRGAGG